MKKSLLAILFSAIILTGSALFMPDKTEAAPEKVVFDMADMDHLIVVPDPDAPPSVAPSTPTAEEIAERMLSFQNLPKLVEGAAEGIHFVTAGFDVDAVIMDPVVVENNLWYDPFFRHFEYGNLFQAALTPMVTMDDWDHVMDRTISGLYHLMALSPVQILGSDAQYPGNGFFTIVVQVYENEDLGGFTHIDGNKIYFADIAEHIILRTDKHTVYDFTELVHGEPIEQLCITYGMPAENLDHAMEMYSAIIRTIASLKYVN